MLIAALLATGLGLLATGPGTDRRLVDTKSSGGSIKNNITNAGPPDDGVATCDTNKLWRSTPENWKAGQTDEFLKRRLDQGSTQRTNLLQSLVDDYATGVDNFVCNEEHPCHLASCSVMRKDVKEARQAYLTISAMANYNDAVNMYLNALKHAQTQPNSFAAGFLGVFSVKSLPPEFDPTTTQVMNTCLSFILVVRIGFLAGPVVSKMGSIPGHFLNGVNIFMQAKQKNWTPIASIGNLVGFISDAATAATRRDNEALLAGRQDGAGLDVADYLRDGSMAHPVVDKTQEIADFISTQLASIVLNNMWIEQHTYIVATPTKNCHADRRGPQETKFCREGDANVYYAYLILDEPGITAVPWQSVRLPKGYDRLDMFGQNITLHNILESSVLAFYSDVYRKSQPLTKLDVSRVASYINMGATLSKGANVPGLFNIPVCYNYDGSQQVEGQNIWREETGHADLDSKFKAKFPCQCGPNGRDTDSFRNVTGLYKVQKYRTWCGWMYAPDIDKKETEDDIRIADVWIASLAQIHAPTTG